MQYAFLTRIAPDPIFSIPPDPDRISEVEYGWSRIWMPGVVDETLEKKNSKQILEFVHCFVLELDTAFCSLMYGQELCEKLSKIFSVSDGNQTADPACWEPDLNLEKAPDFQIWCNPIPNILHITLSLTEFVQFMEYAEQRKISSLILQYTRHSSVTQEFSKHMS
jgi:hypothetical protein